jgi:hypothetical protein
MMKAAAWSLLIASLVLASASDADASDTRKGKRWQTSPLPAARAQSRHPTAEKSYSGYYERIEDRVPFGSRIWWDVYSSMPRGG